MDPESEHAVVGSLLRVSQDLHQGVGWRYNLTLSWNPFLNSLVVSRI